MSTSFMIMQLTMKNVQNWKKLIQLKITLNRKKKIKDYILISKYHDILVPFTVT